MEETSQTQLLMQALHTSLYNWNVCTLLSCIILICMGALIFCICTLLSCIKSQNLRKTLSPPPNWFPVPPPPPPPPPPPTPFQTSPTLVKSQLLAFSDATVDPYAPTIYVEDRLWTSIGGHSVGTEERPLGKTAMFAAHSLREHKRGNWTFRETTPDEVEQVLRLARDIAAGCLDKKNETNGYLYTPETVRDMQLTRNLGDKIKVYSLGRWIKGTLLAFSDSNTQYSLEIRLEKALNGLSVIHVPIRTREWFQGSELVKFLDCADCSDSDADMAEVVKVVKEEEEFTP
ncbi:hypothetical protein CC80DRAFT_583902 [Byssothecium circinans]|uniref:Uncharacterized protein n=1 Tax=Byssothecium circinans TaxID=147558 RepID=A0A6A5T7H4_9PLEO|nr:hypothetical protein CC80DRAFT_583902 [Byssothecium circinans]